MHKCEICNKSFKRVQSLRLHNRTHKVIVKTEPQILVKLELFSDENQIEANNDCIQFDINELIEPVSISNPENTSKKVLRTPKVRIKSLKKSLSKPSKSESLKQPIVSSRSHNICPVCGSVSRCLRDLERHLWGHTVHKDPVKCPKCDKIFEDSTNLHKHLADHKKRRPYKCEICPKQYTSLEQLKTHKIYHSENKPFECQICKSTFSEKRTWKLHLRTHSDERSYGCPNCEKSYKRAGDMRRHCKTAHSYERHFKCCFCLKTYNRKDVLMEHLKLHTGETHHECVVCDKRFATYNQWYTHRWTHQKPSEKKMGLKTEKITDL